MVSQSLQRFFFVVVRSQKDVYSGKTNKQPKHTTTINHHQFFWTRPSVSMLAHKDPNHSAYAGLKVTTQVTMPINSPCEIARLSHI